MENESMMEAAKDKTETAAKESSLATRPTFPGYGGWLKFFCIIQIYILPAATLLFGVLSLASGGEMPFGLQLLLVGGSIALAVFGAFVGIWLRRLEPAAIFLAKVYLVIRVVWTAVALATPAILLWNDTYDLETPFFVMVSAVTWSALWFTYFSISKRIKTTFLTEQV
jgi:hypothetical protein